jgi:hypothetical protein
MMAMEDRRDAAVEIVEDSEQLEKNVNDGATLERALFVDHLPDRCPLDVLHHQKGGGRAIPNVLEGLIDVGDAMVAHRAQHVGLALEQLICLPILAAAGVQQFDRDGAIVLAIPRQKRAAERALAEGPENLVSTADELRRDTGGHMGNMPARTRARISPSAARPSRRLPSR